MAALKKTVKEPKEVKRSVCGADLCVDQGVVEKDEPVDGEPPGVLQGQSLVAALTDEPAVRLPQRVLTTAQ